MSEQATCPQCASTSIQAVPIPKKKLANAVVTEYFLGTAAGVAAGSTMVIQAVCLSCGMQWFPGTAQEREIRALSGQLGEHEQQTARAVQQAMRDAPEEPFGKHFWIVLAIGVGLLVLFMVMSVK